MFQSISLSVEAQLGICAMALFIVLAIITNLLDNWVRSGNPDRVPGDQPRLSALLPGKPKRWKLPDVLSPREMLTINPALRQARGRYYVLSLFVSGKTRLWTAPKVKETKHQLKVAEQWIKKEVARYGVKDLEFVNGYLGDGSNGIAPWRTHLPSHDDGYQSKYNLAESMTRYIIDQSLVTQARAGMQAHHCQHFAVILFLECNDRSHVSFLNNFIPIVVTYARSSDGELELTSGIIAHELLHSIGYAIDLYERPGYSRAKSDRAEQLFPNSIMISSRYIRSSELDPVNAWQIGVGPYRTGYEWFR